MADVLTPFVWLLCASAAWTARDVIVIGAGAAGLMAARRLTNEGGINVTVLEARPDRYGGRIWTNTARFTNLTGPEVEMGGSFVHNPSAENEVAQLLRQFDIPILELNETTILAVREEDGTVIGRDAIDTAWGNLYSALGMARKYGLARGTDESMKATLSKSNASQMIGGSLAQTLLAEVEFDKGAPMDKISSIQFDEDYENDADLDNFVTANGYSEMLDMLVQSKASESRLDVRLGKEVTQVSILTNRRVAVTCKDGSTYGAEAVVVTLPLGVLKAKVVSFTPKLPQAKLDAVHRIGFGVINKVILEFDTVFWPENVYHFYPVSKNANRRGDLNLIANLFPVTHSPILVCYAVSNFGEISESWSDEDLKTLALSQLRIVFGSVMDTVTVVNMARSRWLADPFARGAYSFPAVGAKPDDWATVGEPTPPLFFAGEHTDSDHYATVQGAIKTGWRAAGQTIDYLKASNDVTKIRQSSNVLLLALILAIMETVILAYI